MGGQGGAFVALHQEGVDRTVQFVLLVLVLHQLALEALDLAADRSGRVFEVFQVIFDLADILVDHGQAIGLERLVHHVVQIGRDQGRNFFQKRCHRSFLLCESGMRCLGCAELSVTKRYYNLIRGKFGDEMLTEETLNGCGADWRPIDG